MVERANVSVLVADDHPLFRLGLTMALKALGYGRVLEAVDGQHAVDLSGRGGVDVVVLDLRMPRMNGIEAARLIGERRTDTSRVPIRILLTTYDEPAIIREAGRVGVAAFLSKETEPDVLARTIDELLSGRRDSLLPPAAAVPSLTPREREVLALIADGWAVKAVAEDLRISPETVKDHVANVYSKLGVRERVSAVREARRLGWLLLDELDMARDGKSYRERR